MPELPEVEVVKRSLTNKIQNLIIKKVKINDGKLRYRINENKIKKIIGCRLKKIERKSKYLLFFFNKNIIMLVHLGMTGKFFIIEGKHEFERNVIVEFPSVKIAKDCYNSSEYQEAKSFRIGKADFNAIIIEGYQY